MKVTLINYTQNALNLLLKTKNTRLGNEEDPAKWNEQKKKEHLQYMLNTIRSSWEMIDFIFEITEVTRAFTHQLVRTRAGSYAQQSQRVVDARSFPVKEPESVAAKQIAHNQWAQGLRVMVGVYGDLIDAGIPVQDARGILPTNITTSIHAKFNLRTLHDMALVRLCTRTQGEYQDVFRAMRAAVVDVYPWANDFINVQCVAEGTCAFPNYGPKECPVWFPALDRSEAKNVAAARFWSQRHESRPEPRK